MVEFCSIGNNVRKIGDFNGDAVLHPVHQCQECGHSISPGFEKSTGVCGMCYEGQNSIGEYVERIYSVAIYCSDFTSHNLTKAIQGEVKQGEYADEMADILKWGVENLNSLDSADYLVPPPRGTDDADVNHMKIIGKKLSSEVGISLRDPLRKSGSYKSQKEIDDPEMRLENVKDNIESIEDFEGEPTVIVIDDVVTSTGTMKYSAKALLNSGAGQVFGLTIGRSEGIEYLEEAEVYRRVEE
jgi:predicted amidophosphoribosyltransferase